MRTVRFTQAARRHKVGQARVRYVIANPLVVLTLPGEPDDRIVYLGDDHTGRALEVIVVDQRDHLLVIHAQDLQDKFRRYYDQAKEDPA